ncbi:MAG: DUF2007 domain-containing protein [Desulfobulbaceae bacterium]|jgi:hypothetical protein|nr:DUF2007 domain-containing protein [Desulfobulbaceae bacterium]
MIPIYQPDNPADLALAESLLMAEGIPYFVHNRNFGDLYPGVQIGLPNVKIGLYNVRTFMVREEDAVRAREVLATLLTSEQESVPISRPRPSFWQIVRMVFEVIFCGWFIPATPRRRDKESPDNTTLLDPP